MLIYYPVHDKPLEFAIMQKFHLELRFYNPTEIYYVTKMIPWQRSTLARILSSKINTQSPFPIISSIKAL